MEIIVGPLLYVLSILIGLLKWSVILGVILSWLLSFNIVNPHNQFVNTVGEILFRMTEPFLAPIRRLLPSFSGIDFSPLVLILILVFLDQVIYRIAFRLGGLGLQ